MSALTIPFTPYVLTPSTDYLAAEYACTRTERTPYANGIARAFGNRLRLYGPVTLGEWLYLWPWGAGDIQRFPAIVKRAPRVMRRIKLGAKP
jgi:hypothetical protein